MYSATKHALNGFVKGVSLEYGRFGVRANVLSLGVAPVGLVNKVPEKRLNDIVKRSATGKMIEIDSIVQSLEFLRTNNDVNGSVLFCDGGYF
jgi:NAD(P)-dependent dehydrogenase (short-subunit alcohol dehydrogenase family)